MSFFSRTLSSEENTVFCLFDDEDNFEEFYDLDKDPYQMENTAANLDEDRREFYLDKLDKMRSCSGREECGRAERMMRRERERAHHREETDTNVTS